MSKILKASHVMISI